MENNISYEGGFKFKPDYKWPEKGTKKECPRCNEQLELIENRKTYFRIARGNINFFRPLSSGLHWAPPLSGAYCTRTPTSPYSYCVLYNVEY